ncbi:uncharacterized protein LOC143048475 [Mytilus galloprovincialis]|uniref:uncharacterized protein LOC143048475 n=1 Tax=Mytilus galloprovincialis TaxID=29158 RepID=UPI003F7B76FB
MVGRKEVLSLLVSTVSTTVECARSSTCMALDGSYWNSCYYGCCGNSTFNGYGTTPCCQNEDPPQYSYLLLAIGLLIPCAICLMVLRRTGERCRRPVPVGRSRGEENLRGNMPGYGGRRLMVTTIADLLMSSRDQHRDRCDSTAEIITPPAYEDVVKESNDEYLPPAYSEVLKMDSECPNPLYVMSQSHPYYHSNNQTTDGTVIQGPSSSIDNPDSSENHISISVEHISPEDTGENVISESSFDNRGFTPETSGQVDRCTPSQSSETTTDNQNST